MGLVSSSVFTLILLSRHISVSLNANENKSEIKEGEAESLHTVSVTACARPGQGTANRF